MHSRHFCRFGGDAGAQVVRGQHFDVGAKDRNFNAIFQSISSVAVKVYAELRAQDS